jgi:flavorubredoxin/NADPH-dependent 2,4-dienoyl-CoA reductase/sulfur reductase-like enzyme/rubredoxin
MQAIKMQEGVFWVGVRDPELRIFDLVMTTDYGTSYNAYLIKGTEKTALIEVCEDKFFDQYLENVKSLVNISDIDYLIMNHTEPDHSEAAAKLLDLTPNLTVLASPTALQFLKEISNSSFASHEVADGEEIDLGGKTLRFINVPFLHWPDTIYTYLVEDKILFSCDSFGSHYPDERLFNDLMENDFVTPYKEYFDAIIGPFKPYVLEALDKIKDLPTAMIAPGHGPILRKDIDKYIELYRQWSQPPEKGADGRPKIVMAYISIYGYTKMLADALLEGISTIGDFDIQSFSLVEDKLDDDDLINRVVEAITSADGFLLGSNTVNGDALPQVWKLLSRLSPITHGDKLAMAFGAYGWSGEAVPSIEHRLNALRMQVLPGYRVNFRPSSGNLEEAFSLGMDFARAVLTKKQDESQTRWRCLVCGYIHVGAEPPEICPACGVGKENFVRESIEDEFINDSKERFAIIGGGIAALSAAEAIRKRNRTAEIIMLSEEKNRPYFRPALSDLLSEDLPDNRLFVYDNAWYENNRIDLRTATRVAKIDTTAKKLELENGQNIEFDKLIIATGARSNIPPINGAEKQGVFSLRSLEDAFTLKEAMKSAKKAVVIGGGVLGLEAVWEMVSNKIPVTVVEHNQRLMPRQLDEASSARLQELIIKKGVKLCLGVATEEIMGESQVTGVKLSNGEILEADLVLLSTGVRPNVKLAQEAGINVEQGIVVDDNMRTSVNNIYAAGDVAQFGERPVGLWPVSMEMGRIAGAAAAGDWVQYKQPLLSTMLVAFDREIFSIGEVNLPAEECRVVEVVDPVEQYYKKSYIKDGVLLGEIIIAPQVDASESMNKLGRDESGEKHYQRWKCKVCGYIHEGPEPPDECPLCGAPKDMFEPIE